MKRRQLAYLEEWFDRKTRKPLIVRGARQVGKTTLVRMLAKSLGKQLLELNMEDVHKFVPLLENNDPLTIFEIAALERGIQSLDPEGTLVFFDEAQECPQLVAFLRYCYERTPQFRVVLAGSLLEFVLEDYQYSFPVGRVEFMYMGPLDFEEYLTALGQDKLVEIIGQHGLQDTMPEPIQQILEGCFRDFLVCGGMPAAVKIKSEGGSLLEIERAKSEILEAYYADFPKYHKRADTELLQTLYQNVPLQIGNKIRPAKLVDGRRARDVWKHLAFLEQALLIRRCTHTNADELPLAAGKVEKVIKLLFLDVGLVQTMLGVTIPDIEITQDINSLARGALAEQFIGQHLTYQRPPFQKPEVYHWNRPIKGSEAEVDYVVALENKVLPVEVKSGSGGTMKALRLMLAEKKLSCALRFYSGPLRVDSYSIDQQPYTLLSVPHYMVGQWPRLAKACFVEL